MYVSCALSEAVEGVQTSLLRVESEQMELAEKAASESAYAISPQELSSLLRRIIRQVCD